MMAQVGSKAQSDSAISSCVQRTPSSVCCIIIGNCLSWGLGDNTSRTRASRSCLRLYGDGMITPDDWPQFLHIEEGLHRYCPIAVVGSIKNGNELVKRRHLILKGMRKLSASTTMSSARWQEPCTSIALLSRYKPGFSVADFLGLAEGGATSAPYALAGAHNLLSRVLPTH